MKQEKDSAKSSRNANALSAPAPLTVRIPQAVGMLGLSRSKLYEFIKSGDIEIIKVGRSTLIPIDSLTHFIAARRTQ